jgi:hypothetical protein
MKNCQPLTSGHKTLGVKWLINRSASHQGSVSGDTDTAPKSPTFHTANRSPDIAFGSSGERTEDYILHSTPRLTATS